MLSAPKLLAGLQLFLLSFTYVPLQTSCLLEYLASEMCDSEHSSSPHREACCPPPLPAHLHRGSAVTLWASSPCTSSCRVCPPNSSHMPLFLAHFLTVTMFSHKFAHLCKPGVLTLWYLSQSLECRPQDSSAVTEAPQGILF